MIDWEGNMIEPRHRTRIIVDELPDANDAMIASVTISAIESKTIDDNIVHQDSTFDDCMIANSTFAATMDLRPLDQISHTFQKMTTLSQLLTVTTKL